MSIIEKLSIEPPDDKSRIDFIEDLIGYCERRGCTVTINPHQTKPTESSVQPNLDSHHTDKEKTTI